MVGATSPAGPSSAHQAKGLGPAGRSLGARGKVFFFFSPGGATTASEKIGWRRSRSSSRWTGRFGEAASRASFSPNAAHCCMSLLQNFAGPRLKKIRRGPARALGRSLPHAWAVPPSVGSGPLLHFIQFHCHCLCTSTTKLLLFSRWNTGILTSIRWQHTRCGLGAASPPSVRLPGRFGGRGVVVGEGWWWKRRIYLILQAIRFERASAKRDLKCAGPPSKRCCHLGRAELSARGTAQPIGQPRRSPKQITAAVR